MLDFHKSFSSWLWHTSLCLENPWSPSPTSSQWRTSRPSLGTRPRRGRELIFVVLSIVLRGRVSPVAVLASLRPWSLDKCLSLWPAHWAYIILCWKKGGHNSCTHLITSKVLKLMWYQKACRNIWGENIL